MSNATISYAVIFRTHFWDDFVERQFQRLSGQVKSGDIYVLVDETRGAVPGISGHRVFRLTDNQILAAGYVHAGEGSMQWYSGDVPLYMFEAAHPDYDFYIQLEYDVNINVDLDTVVERIAADGVDVVALTKGKPTANWMWLDTCLDVYGRHEVQNKLICLSIFSSRALRSLRQARLAHAARFRCGEIGRWPYCEGFVPTEAARQGLRQKELSAYGDVSAYDWWPPYLEADLPRLGRHDFLHPVLDTEKYRTSLFKINAGLKAILWPFSWYHRRLRRLGGREYAAILFGGPLQSAFVRAFRRKFGSVT